jgi:hypothetical protein
LRERADVRPTRADSPQDDKTQDDETKTMLISPQEILEIEVLVPAYSMRSYTFEKSQSR